jgi:hypothetical protein
MKKWIFVALLVVFGTGAYAGLLFEKSVSNRVVYANKEALDLIRVISPLRNATVTSSFVVSGEARGMWYFEASFPVRLYDAQGELLGTSIAQAQGDWMTENFVPFSATLTFIPPSTDTGTLVFQKDNPSGLPENDKEVRIPVTFDITKNPKRRIFLYYYNGNKDSDEQGNIACSKEGIVPVERSIPVTMSPIQTTLKMLLAGEITSEEKAQGISTFFPLEGVSISDISFVDGVLVLTFNDPLFRTSGGACRANILRMQVEQTAQQFETVKEVKIKPDSVFQP